MSEKAPELKPCPFCGAPEPRLATSGARSIIICDGCGAQVPFQLTQRAVEYWNLRADVPWLPEELVARVRNIVRNYDVPWDADKVLRDILAALAAGEKR